MNTTYTNTSSVKAVIGLVVLSLAVAYVQQNATEIVYSSKRMVVDAAGKLNEVLHRGKKPYAVCERTYDGRIIDTGKRIWK